MPDLKDIELFKSKLDAISDEKRYVEARGEKIEELAPPVNDVEPPIEDNAIEGNISDPLDDDDSEVFPIEDETDSAPEFFEPETESAEETDFEGPDLVADTREDDFDIGELDPEESDLSLDDFSDMDEPVPSFDDDAMALDLSPEAEEIADSGSSDIDEVFDGISRELSDDEESVFDSGTQMDQEQSAGVLSIDNSEFESTDDDSADDPPEEIDERITDIDSILQTLGDKVQDLEKQEVEKGESAFGLSDEEFPKLFEKMKELPLNLKIAIEDEIGNNNLTPDGVVQICQEILNDSPPKKIAETFFNVSGKRIPLPKGLLLRSGYQVEEEKKKFFHQFKIIALPRIRKFIFIALPVWVVLMALFFLAYRPLYAYYLYNQGEILVNQDRYPEAKTLFNLARFGWPLGSFDIQGVKSKYWHNRYIDAFLERRQYREALYQTEELIRDYPANENARIRESEILAEHLVSFEEAEGRLNEYLEVNRNAYGALFALANVYFAWGSEEESKNEMAKVQYSNVLNLSRNLDDRAILGLLRSYIRDQRIQFSENVGREIETLSYLLLEKKRIIASKDEVTDSFTEVADYYMENGKVTDSRVILNRLLENDPSHPAVHFTLSHYYLTMQNTLREEATLKETLFFLERYSPKDEKDYLMELSVYDRLGNIAWLDRKDNADAKNNYRKALFLIRNGRNRYIEVGDQIIGKVYANMGDIFFLEENDYASGHLAYEGAHNFGYETVGSLYRNAIYDYQQEDYASALNQLNRARRLQPDNDQIRFALATTMIKRKSFAAAQGYLNESIRRLERELDSLPLINPLLKPEQKHVFISLVKNHNNLGVVYSNQADILRGKDKTDRAMDEFRIALRYLDLLLRDPEDFSPLASTKEAPSSALQTNPSTLITGRGVLEGSTPQQNLWILLHPDAILTQERELSIFEFESIDPYSYESIIPN